MTDEPTFRVRTRAKSDHWFDPAHDHLAVGFIDRPDEEEIRLATWEEPHGHGFTVTEIVIPYQALPALYAQFNQVLAQVVLRIVNKVEELENEADEYKAALHKADLETYMEIFTRRAGAQP
jgi:hypothetical protein